MKEIMHIAPVGATYIDEDGNQQFIDFETCHQNRLREIERLMGDRYTEELKAFMQSAKYIGMRLGLSDPLVIEFYTIPRTVFEFSSSEKYGSVLMGIKKAGWRTNDGE